MTQAVANPVLNPDITYSPVEDAAINNRWKLIWQASAVAAIVGTVAVAFFAAIYTPIFFAAHIAIAALVTAVVIKSYLWDKSTPYAKCADFNSKIIQKLDVLEEAKLGADIEKLGVKPGIEPKELKSVLAYYNYNKEKQVVLAQKIKEHLDVSRDFLEIASEENPQQPVKLKPSDYYTANIDWSNNEQLEIAAKIHGIHLARSKLVREAAIYNLEAAYALMLMQTPYETRSFADFVQCCPFNTLERFINQAIGDPGADIFVKTKTKTFTAEELHTMDTMKLAHEVFELPEPPKGWRLW